MLGCIRAVAVTSSASATYAENALPKPNPEAPQTPGFAAQPLCDGTVAVQHTHSESPFDKGERKCLRRMVERLALKHPPQGLDVLRKRRVAFHQLFDLLDGMNDRRVIAAAEFAPDLG
jgi:hypothetical protein